jgi:tetratricopeptide (TPR) repeat protein
MFRRIAAKVPRTLKSTTLSTTWGIAVIIAVTALSTGFLSNGPVRAESSAKRTSVYGSFLAGRHAVVLKDMASATEFMLRVIEDNPDNVKLVRKSFLLAVSAGKMDAALNLARRIETANGAMPTAKLFLAIESARLGDLQDSLRRFSDLPRKGLVVYSGPLATAWIQAGLGNFDAALAALSPLDEKSGFLTLHHLHAGLIQDLAGRTTAAEESFRKSASNIKKAPVRLLRALGSLMERGGRVDEARVLYEDFLAANSSNLVIRHELARLNAGDPAPRLVGNAAEGIAESLFHIASVLPRRRAGDIALVYSRIARYMRPDFAVNTLLLGEILESREQFISSNETYESVDVKSPYRWTARLRIADNLDALDHKKESIDLLRIMASEKPDRIDALFKLASALRLEEQYEDALVAYDKAYARIKTVQTRHWLFFYNRGIALERSKQWDRAEADFLKALELLPEQPYVLNYLGYSWVERGKNLEQAQEMIERAVAQRRNDGYIVDSLGWVLYQVGKYEKAVKQLERAVRLRPHDPVINDHLGDAYWRAGRKLEAKFQWRRSLSLEPEIENQRKTQAKLENGPGEAKPVESGG